MKHPDVVIVGGGVIGLSIAWELARAGLRPTVLDAGELGRAASWAGAGIIAPEAQRSRADPLTALRNLSVRLHPEWARALLDETSIDTGYRCTGGVDVAASSGEDAELQKLADGWRAEGIAFERLEPADFGRVEPSLSRRLHSGYFLPGRAQIRNPWHLNALIAACKGRRVGLFPGRAATAHAWQGERITAVQTGSGSIFCDIAVIAAGPWSEGLLKPLGLQVPTPPVKGQIVLLRSDPHTLSRIIEHGKNYLVPRGEGRILVGSTEEDAGFDTRTTSVAIRDLLDEALRLCPVLSSAEVERTWAGLRPGSIDSRPYLGLVPGFENLYLASGHQRAGLQLSPGTAVLMADLILGQQPRLDMEAFRPDRSPVSEERPSFRS
jgi:glycine oxidase